MGESIRWLTSQMFCCKCIHLAPAQGFLSVLKAIIISTSPLVAGRYGTQCFTFFIYFFFVANLKPKPSAEFLLLFTELWEGQPHHSHQLKQVLQSLPVFHLACSYWTAWTRNLAITSHRSIDFSFFNNASWKIFHQKERKRNDTLLKL